MPVKDPEIVVIGAGHAGCEAAWAAANLGVPVLLATSDPANMAQMSCNPSVGGVAKGQLVREIDALGGVMARATDAASIQFRMLNTGKGPAVRAPRSQSDRKLYVQAMRGLIESHPHIRVIRAMVSALEVSGGRVRGVVTSSGQRYCARAVVLTAGTFLNGLIRIGDRSFPAGRAGDPASEDLAVNLKALGLPAMRFKTGTPPRLDGRTVDYARLVEQPGDDTEYFFSFFHRAERLPQVSCWQTRTSAETRRLVLDNLKLSSLYGGYVEGRGPRYCPSIEDKFVRFPEREIQHLFLEPEGIDTREVYLNGLSNSMPHEVQERMVHSVEGLEQAEIVRHGYAIEYDCYDPRALKPTLESSILSGLYLAGQVNGTSGYEEAAGQGLVAGLNAARALQDRQEVTFSRTESYLGVMLDDIVGRGVDEPYRLFSSRAEFRLHLRQDNADLRLAPLAYELGLIGPEQIAVVEAKKALLARCRDFLSRTRVSPERINPYLESVGSASADSWLSLEKLLRRPEVSLASLFGFLGPWEFTAEELEKILPQVELEVKYAGYLDRELARMDQLRRMEEVKIPPDLDFSAISTISHEGRERLARCRPSTLGQASRLPGLTPGDLSVLMVELGKHGRKRPAG
ncbi:MAG: tRNA uridine-5-carboxymethylaminomethyl(34) synthesis enzyme MnmG [Candidatus Glassbacteria bacterium]|nr:tRNA uridine-5-carboxymethylaminomethyl(34) synthesis enzyme MnmG [Candidatus Glassbacteria bacterium]